MISIVFIIKITAHYNYVGFLCSTLMSKQVSMYLVCFLWQNVMDKEQRVIMYINIPMTHFILNVWTFIKLFFKMNKNKILFSYNFDKYFYIYYLSCTFISLILKTVTMCDSVLWIGHKSQEGWISRMPVLHAWLASVCDGSYAWLALTWYPESRMRHNESM